MRMKLGGAMGVVLATLLGACSDPPPPPPAEPTQPLDTRPTEPPAADPSVPVASGNTPTAADIAAIAGLGAQFDPARDPADDLATAKVEAQRGNKRILLEVGNAACDRCHALDAIVEGNADLRRFRDAHYVWVKVNASDEQPNSAFFTQFPVMERDYPYLLVLGADGGLLVSQPTTGLRRGEAFQPARISAFLKQWAPAR
ncbi:thioredoxin family protein [Stenotrophomonas sp. 24(2023)]|uniref:thioredoxin family protein n=1 Tax=Stenotrophomonas sp. 24(2023) TaxID=3068324 RepID=UPI0027E0EEF4|nr:thioredoxin family protein [Stenotrophomonas sp. 24(2023)]WMJ70793.1 thioredoxin family protein [Stenotrophomonas sp. 24(2023)]